jgi:hypothetical protein
MDHTAQDIQRQKKLAEMVEQCRVLLQQQQTPPCPKCGGRMHLVNPKPGQEFKPFYGCDEYPDCKGTKSLDEN